MNKETKLYTSDEKPHFRTDVFLYRLQIVKYCYLLFSFLVFVAFSDAKNSCSVFTT